MIAISKSLLTEAQPVNGLRVPKCNHIDGWYLWSGGDLPQDPDFFHPIHPAHLISKRPLIMKYLGLPYGYRFQLDEKGYEDIWFDQSILETDR
ncbi:MAG: hypothetical protein EOP48_04380 [Sphingobacteriales bacterium]|nr:MAG: hypothetical protein EOP48_04380 [Sphingobacteriales bacterium]